LNKERKHTYTIKEHGDGKTYDITEHDAEPIQKQEIDTDKLIAEARSLIEYNKRHEEKTKQQEPKQQTKREIELEKSRKQWEQYFKEHPDKIPYNLDNY
jgi:hypothetical protein